MKYSYRVVECFGIPGTGKSTLCKTLSAILADATVFVDYEGRQFWRQNVPFHERLAIDLVTLGDVRLWVLVGRLALSLNAFLHVDAMRRLIQLPFKRSRLRRLAASNFLILDQGMLQDFWSIMLSARAVSPDPLPLSKLMGELYRDIDLTVVHLQLTQATAAERITARHKGFSRFDGKSSADIARQLEDKGPLLDIIADLAAANGGGIFRYDSSCAAAELARKVLRDIGA